jgi:hypothetical protein
MENKRNLWLLPTDKPSILFKDDFDKYFISKNIDQEQNHFTPQNISITSDEEIKVGDYVLYHEDKISQVLGINIDELKLDRGGVWRSSCKKIILTTDQDLIQDSVQAIDDDFLEWFVNNPSCEFVDTSLVWETATIFEYFIIIPKEEPKQN